MQNDVEANYVDGHPRHFHASARQIAFDPEHANASGWFITSAQDFLDLSEEQISQIHKHRNIVVQAPVGAKVAEFGVNTLRRLHHCRDKMVLQGG